MLSANHFFSAVGWFMVRLHHNGVYIVRMGLFLLLAIMMLGAGCSPVSSSTAVSASPAGASTGPVLISQDAVPTGIKYKELGTVRANYRAGYSNAESLYPLLAAEARKLGANAVVDAKGWHAPNLFSWAAAYATGTAVRIEDPESLRRLSGSSY